MGRGARNTHKWQKRVGKGSVQEAATKWIAKIILEIRLKGVAIGETEYKIKNTHETQS